MKTTTVIPLLMLITLLLAPRAFAQHSDIEFIYQGSTFELEGGQPGALGNVYEGDFPTSGIFERFTSNPGFASETAEGLGIGPGETIDYQIVESPLGYLGFWDAATQDFAATSATITIVDNPSGSLVVSQTAGGSGPGAIGISDAAGDFHSHIDYELSGDASPGAYGYLMSLRSDNASIADSAPLWIVFNYGLEEELGAPGAHFQDAVEAFAAVPEPASIALALIGVVVVVPLALRRQRARWAQCTR